MALNSFNDGVNPEELADVSILRTMMRAAGGIALLPVRYATDAFMGEPLAPIASSIESVDEWASQFTQFRD
jgi:hypothetical protein